METVKKHFTIGIPIFYSSINVFLSPMFAHPFTEYDDVKCKARICFNTIPEIDIITHEVIHAIKAIMDDRDIDDEEVLCYLSGYTVKQIYNKFKNEQHGKENNVKRKSRRNTKNTAK
jgi:hypothetical protein